jgi:hypothetical protein
MLLFFLIVQVEKMAAQRQKWLALFIRRLSTEIKPLQS